MLGRIILLFASLVLLVVAVPVPTSEVDLSGTAIEGLENLPLSRSQQDAMERSPIIEPIPVNADVAERKRDESDQHVDSHDDVGSDLTEVRARGTTRGKGNSGRATTRGKGNSGRDLDGGHKIAAEA